MSLTSLSFLYLFLPLSLALYYLISPRARGAVLLAISLVFWSLASWDSLLLMLASVILDYGAMVGIAAYRGRPALAKLCAAFSTAKNICLILYISAIPPASRLGAVIGVFVYSFTALEGVLSFYRSGEHVPPSPIAFFLNCTFFPKLYAGPLQRLEDFSPQLEEIQWKPSDMLAGLSRFLQGALKVHFLGAFLSDFTANLGQYAPEAVSILSSWLMVFSFALSVYYRFSGYCDMAQGIGRLFGLRLPLNFYYPYQSLSLHDFIQRFNRTVWSFIRQMVYVELQEEKNGPLSDALNLLCCGILAGLWFGLDQNHLIWGVYIACFLIMEQYLYPRTSLRLPIFFGRVYTLIVVVVGFAILLGNSPGETLTIVGNMVGLGGLPLADPENQLLYQLSNSWQILLLSAFLATSVCNAVVQKVKDFFPPFYAAMNAVCSAGMLILVTAVQI